MSERRQWALRSLALLVLPALLGWAAPFVTVSQSGRAFSVPHAEVSRGGVLRFRNEDEFLHQLYVKSPGFSVDAGEQEPGQFVDVRFPVPGTFAVRCEIHPKMLLTVIVD